MVTRAWVPKDWDKDFKSYQLRGNEQLKRSALSGGNNCRSTDLQRERFEQRRREDEAYWRELNGGGA